MRSEPQRQVVAAQDAVAGDELHRQALVGAVDDGDGQRDLGAGQLAGGVERREQAVVAARQRQLDGADGEAGLLQGADDLVEDGRVLDGHPGRRRRRGLDEAQLGALDEARASVRDERALGHGSPSF